MVNKPLFASYYQKMSQGMKITMQMIKDGSGKPVPEGKDQIMAALKQNAGEAVSILLSHGFLMLDVQTLKNLMKTNYGVFMLGALLSLHLKQDIKKSTIEEALNSASKTELQQNIATFVGKMAGIVQTDNIQLLLVHSQALVRNSTKVGTGPCFEISGATIELASSDVKALGEFATSGIAISMISLYVEAYCLIGIVVEEESLDLFG